MSEQGPGYGARRLHFVSHQLFVGHAVGERALALVQPLDPVGFEVDVAGNILYVLHVRPAGKGDGSDRTSLDEGSDSPASATPTPCTPQPLLSNTPSRPHFPSRFTG